MGTGYRSWKDSEKTMVLKRKENVVTVTNEWENREGGSRRKREVKWDWSARQQLVSTLSKDVDFILGTMGIF